MIYEVRRCVVFPFTVTRKKPTPRIQALDGKVISGVSRKTDYVLAGEDADSKLDKAQKLSVTVNDDKEFLKMCRGV